MVSLVVTFLSCHVMSWKTPFASETSEGACGYHMVQHRKNNNMYIILYGIRFYNMV